MGPMNDDDDDNDEMVMRPAAATPVKSDVSKGAPEAGNGGDLGEVGDSGDPGDNLQRLDEGLGFPGIEEAGYGYGV